MRFRFRGILGAATLASLVAACGGSSSTAPAPTPSVSGTWNYSETQNDSQHSISCDNSGTITINQSGTTFTGSYTQQGTCTGPGGTADNSGAGNVSGGQITNRNVSFQADYCKYTGSVGSGDAPNTMSGTGTCTLTSSGTTYNFDVTWQASR